jgi:hypothetical protein
VERPEPEEARRAVRTVPRVEVVTPAKVPREPMAVRAKVVTEPRAPRERRALPAEVGTLGPQAVPRNVPSSQALRPPRSSAAGAPSSLPRFLAVLRASAPCTSYP